MAAPTTRIDIDHDDWNLDIFCDEMECYDDTTMINQSQLDVEMERWATESQGTLDFGKIFEICRSLDRTAPIPTQSQLAEHRRTFWPALRQGIIPAALERAYNRVRKSGVSNSLAVKDPIKTNLNIDAWKKWLHVAGAPKHILKFIMYGFPMGYMGPTSNTIDCENHASATNFDHQVECFIRKEMDSGMVFGPFPECPFIEWAHVSPMMTQPKGEEKEHEKKEDMKRRVILDLSYPLERSVNAFIFKGAYMGVRYSHTLPTVDDVIADIILAGNGAFMFTLDIARAYKNFVSCPLFWPLLVFRWKSGFYIDISIPFGSRVSSLHMQSIANILVTIIKAQGVAAHMYLDDLIVIGPDKEKMTKAYNAARRVLHELGLPEATDKLQSPRTRVKWLGVWLDTGDMSIKMPEEKILATQREISKATASRTISKKKLQSIVGKVQHLGKCVPPARLFIARLLEALRGNPDDQINIHQEMSRDFQWLLSFLKVWNGRSILKDPHAHKHIWVFTNETSMAAWDGESGYEMPTIMPDPTSPHFHREVLNVLLAMSNIIQQDSAGTTVRITLQSQQVAEFLTTGRVKDTMVLNCARKIWAVCARMDVLAVYESSPDFNRENNPKNIYPSTKTLCNIPEL